jgi:hypothetical protein
MSEFDYLYKYDAKRHAYVGRSPGAEKGTAIPENRPLLIILQSENDQATGTYFPIGTGLFNLVNLRFHWDKVPVPAAADNNCLKGSSIPRRRATTNTWSIIMSFHWERRLHRLV